MSIRSFEGKTPRIHPSAYVDQDAVLIGDVEVGEECVILPGAVIRADHGTTRIGNRSNVQDNAVIHTGGVEIGEDVTIGHAAVVEARKIGHHSLIGINASLLADSEIGEFCLVAAGAIVKEGARIPPYSFVAGVPAQVKPIKKELADFLKTASELYTCMIPRYKAALE